MNPDFLNLLLNGDHGTWRQFADLYGDSVLGVIRKFHRGDDAKDCYQEFMIRLRSRLASYDQGRPFEPWLFKVAWNHALRFKEQNKHSDRHVSTTMVDVVDIPSTGPSPDAEINAKDLLDAVTRVAKSYDSDKSVHAFYLLYVNCFEFDEIAELIGVDRDYARVLVSRGRMKVKTRLRELYPGEFE